MRFVIVGASGFIGRHTLAYVRSLGYEARGTQNCSTYSGLIPFNLLEHRIGDCVGKEFFDTDTPVFGVICSAICQIDRCRQEPQLSYKVNVERTIALIEDLFALGATPVFLSSDGIFDGTLGYYSEEHPPSPVNEYGRQKVAVESYLHRAVPKSLTFRLSKIVGDDPLEHHIFSEWWQWLREGRPITCIDGQLFSPTFVDDVAKAIVLACARGLTGVYHVANPELFSRDELARQFLVALRCEAPIICKSQEALHFVDPRPAKSYLDSTRFVRATDMRFTSMRQVITQFIKRLGDQPYVAEQHVPVREGI